ncbi:helix-turn-helix domain-containing protein [Paenibacillus radicis (ex Gao et al. 2016)]|uniref:HTH-type transcriptional regulator YisR n=1 Tax=Paenibacillus radicis (ex Gao et al. 2016) TaxID=1737354 RepID=A0A917GND3_9BACL|nr:AraC family transcriptional regulator [Paenibacillus radicis (ex Gao et al. 2016)]GGG52187.1 putative HTH-type transcriptional regulator YisR [Paenibacillus radicis (ex Gao et al. 2016)]
MLAIELQVPPFPLLTTVGYVLWPSGVTHAERQFDVFDLIICTKGTLYMAENDIEYKIEQGMMLILEPGKTHSGYRPTENETEVYWIHFQYPSSSQPKLIEKQSWQQPLLETTNQDTVPHPAMISIPKFAAIDLRIIVPMLTEMLKVHSVLTPSRSFDLHILFGQLLVQLQNGMITGSSQARSHLIGEKVASYLASRLESPFDSEQMELELHYHFDYLSRCLKQYSGMSPLQYRHQLQIERAKRLLTHSELPLVKIGEQCGFNDYNYFIRLFKRQTSFTPGEYRRRYQAYL